ncbi:MAG: PAS domain-containing protein [Gammaproteobacteria bacterium]|nr:MAG: PAS domain-containing protein [Gammaproteobacteria bacterium]
MRRASAVLPFPARPLTRDALRWRGLRLFSLYRLVIAGLLVTLDFLSTDLPLFNKLLPELYRDASIAYLLLAMALSLMATFHWPRFLLQIVFQATVDLVMILALMHATGGVPGGMGTLLIASVGGISLLAPGRYALLNAAIASIALLGDLAYGYWLGHYSSLAYTQTGILGAILLLTALLASRLSRAAERSEELATQRGRELANLAELNEHIIEQMQSGVLVLNEEGRVLHANHQALRLLGAMGEGLQRIDLLAPELMAAWQAWKAGQAAGRQSVNTGGEERTITFRRIGFGNSGSTLAFIESTEESRRLAQQIKLASLGRLTASIAHEIRNPLGAISHAAQLLEESPKLPPPDRRLVDIIMQQTERMNTVIRNILRLSRSDATQAEDIVLLPWLQDFVSEFTHHHGFSPERMRLHITPADTAIRFDPAQLHQILWNLCSNAKKHACQPEQETCITLQGGHDDNDRPYLDIIDTGPGIPPDVQEHLFEPFFTTRADGVGLGLYIAREMCQNNLAEIEYIPMPMGGSCFRILFATASEAKENS